MYKWSLLVSVSLMVPGLLGSDVLVVSQTLHVIDNQGRPFELPADWREYAHIDSKIGTKEQPLELPMSLEQVLRLDILLRYVREDRIAECVQEQFLKLDFESLLEVYKHIHLLNLTCLLPAAHTSLVHELRGEACFKAYKETPGFINSLGLTHEQGAALARECFSPKECEQLLTRLNVDISVEGAPHHVTLNPSRTEVLVTGTENGKGFCELHNYFHPKSKQRHIVDMPLKKGVFSVGSRVFLQGTTVYFMADASGITNVIADSDQPLWALCIRSDHRQLALGHGRHIKRFTFLQHTEEVVAETDPEDSAVTLFYADQDLVEVRASGKMMLYRSTGEQVPLEGHNEVVTHYYTRARRLITIDKGGNYCVWQYKATKPLVETGHVHKHTGLPVALGEVVPVVYDMPIRFCEIDDQFFESFPFTDLSHQGKTIMITRDGILKVGDVILPWDKKIAMVGMNHDGSALIGVSPEGSIRIWHYFDGIVCSFLDALTLEQSFAVRVVLEDEAVEVPHSITTLCSGPHHIKDVFTGSFPWWQYVLAEQEGPLVDCLERAAQQTAHQEIKELAQFRLGEIAFKEGKYTEALASFNKVMKGKSEKAKALAYGYLAELYYHGWGIAVDLKKAREHYCLSYDNADDTYSRIIALLRVGFMYHVGLGVKENCELAKKNFDAVLALDPPSAEKAQVLFYMATVGNQAASDMAYSAAQKLIVEGQSAKDRMLGKLFLGYIYGNGVGRVANFKQATRYLEEVIDRTDDSLCQATGCRYYVALALDNNVKSKELLTYIKRAIRQGNLHDKAWGIYLRGIFHTKGIDGPVNYVKAVKYLEMVRALPYVCYAKDAASFELGKIYCSGDHGITQDFSKVVDCFSEVVDSSALNNYCKYHAAWHLATILNEGKGSVKEDLKKAHKYFLEVAQNSTYKDYLDEALWNVAEMYCMGKGVSENDEEAYKYFKRIENESENQELRHKAIFRIGELISLNLVAGKKVHEAQSYLERAANRSYNSWAQETAKKILAMLKKK